ncbi:hypothetical protein JVT61DRAFT_4454 [Boletus reticuloceps]|uniref:Uncharacterized protein n=1 Tax=Boletus reticuloceps TaxID=495285 RepID=A0A8I2YMQ2_9AGAM|nr:hypothetical protein JVT61DRAFT_4454 [Boletus reticuloceps]
MAPSTAAAQLKEQGNALFIKKDFVRAHDKYTEAIAIDGRNAVLHANRSACSFGMGKCVSAFRVSILGRLSIRGDACQCSV